MKIIDTHIHVWDLDKVKYTWLNGDTSVLNRTYTIEEIEEARIESGIEAGVFVQAACNMDDTFLMLDIAKNAPWIKGVVGWLPLLDTSATASLIESMYLQNNVLKGVRHLIHDEKDAEWLLQPTVVNSLKLLAKNNLTYDVVGILPQHIKCVIEIAKQIPDLKLVLDHLNAPPIATNEKFSEWGMLMQEVAVYKNVHCKISGLGTASGNFEGRTTEDIIPYVQFIKELFGADRCFCGGDWPVSLLANNYAVTWQQTIEIVNTVFETQEDRNKVFFDNANQFYNLQQKN